MASAPFHTREDFTAPPQYNEVDTAVTKWYSKMMANQVSPKSALAGLDQDITAILKKPA
jgi:hypothetical protein